MIKQYYFCAPGCKEAFEEEPKLYINKEKLNEHQCEHQHVEGKDSSHDNCGCGCGHNR